MKGSVIELNQKRFSFIGAGNMAGAIVKGMLKNHEKENICLFDKDKSRYDSFDQGFYIAESCEEAVDFADYIFLSVKPQNFNEIFSELKNKNIPEFKTIVSIAAGISTDYICLGLGKKLPVIRTMPNTPCLIGQGVTALSKNSLVGEKQFEEIRELFSQLGQAFVIPESKMNDVIAINSSSPAYVYLFAKAMYDTALKMGFEEEGLLDIICGVIKGSASMIQSTGKTPDELIKMVKSPKGTTEKALDKLYELEFEKSIEEAMLACSARAEELEKS